MATGTLGEALKAAFPEHQERESLAKKFHGLTQISSMGTDELVDLEARHEKEIVQLGGVLKAQQDRGNDWARRAQQALRVLRMHRGWICRELAHRRRQAAAERHSAEVKALAAAKIAAARELAQQHDQARTAKAERIAASNAENERQIAAFKDVAREELGEAAYDRLWHLARRRLET